MARELTAEAVAARLDRLRSMVAPLRVDEARRLMEDPPAHKRESFEIQVARRLAELRALLDLTNYLHGGRFP
jgi:hypothetical protein